MKRKIYIVAGLGVLALLIIGWLVGSRERFPREPIRNVSSFSLGSAHFTPFKHRPGAKELYDRMQKLYSSFSTVAVTCSRKDWFNNSVESGCIDMGCYNFRIKQPARVVVVERHSSRYVFITNSTSTCHYMPNSNKYLFVRKIEADHSRVDVLRCLDLINPDIKILRYRLMPDQIINREKVYVLNLTTVEAPFVEVPLGDKNIDVKEYVAKRLHDKAPNTVTRKLYLGKSDLLLRKAEIIDPDEQEAANHQVYSYSGMVANLSLPNRMFDTTPPKGAKGHRIRQ